VVARIVPHVAGDLPESGSEGRRTFFIVADPATVLGENVAIPADDPTAIVSTTQGLLTVVNNRLNVSETLIIDGNIDFHTGNLTCIGAVQVKGSVLSGFSVRAKTLIVEGSIEGATVKTDGNLLVRGGIIGCAAKAITVGGSVLAKYVENSHISARKGIFIRKSALHSHLVAGTAIILIQPPGVLVGGSARATHTICALTVGSKWGTPTTIRLGVNPFREDELQELERLDARYRQELERIAKRTTEIRGDPETANTTTAAAIKRPNEELQRLESKREFITGRRRTLESRIKTLKAALQLEIAAGTRGRLYVFETLHPGVALSIKESFLNSDAVHSSVYFYADGQEIRLGKP
jgi:hypothetical protein